MNRRFPILAPAQTLRQATRLFRKKRASAAPVLDASGKLAGIISERDCIRVLVSQTLTESPNPVLVEDLMQAEVYTVSPTTSVTEIATTLHDACFRQVPVVDENSAVLGLVSRRNLIEHLDRVLTSAPRRRQRSLITRRQRSFVGPTTNVLARRSLVR